MAEIEQKELMDIYIKAEGNIGSIISFLEEAEENKINKECEKLINIIIETAQKIQDISPSAVMLAKIKGANGLTVERDILNILAKVEFHFQT